MRRWIYLPYNPDVPKVGDPYEEDEEMTPEDKVVRKKVRRREGSLVCGGYGRFSSKKK